ncbi:MAG: isoamylase [Chlamydiota bacterium]|nr:isoamylase [Chlamydiota bacterium]
MLEAISTERGAPTPYGAKVVENGVNFALYSKYAEEVSLYIFDYKTREQLLEQRLDPERNKTGEVWHILLSGLPEKFCYGYRLFKSRGKLFKKYYNTDFVIHDPYARRVQTSSEWGASDNNYHPLGLFVQDHSFNWENDKPLRIPKEDLVIYEMHVRGFTQHSSSGLDNKKGTFLGVIDKIPHLLDLGVNAVELLPIFEFNECEYYRFNPLNGDRLYNYWGYSTVNFFSPMNRYASSSEPGVVVDEFKTMVKELHKNGIEVILDVVFNHTAEGNEDGPIYSFKGVDCGAYYIVDHKHRHMNFTGCGNTFYCNNTVAKDFIKKCLQYWVSEMHVDGFRFDLASAFFRGFHGEVLNRSPILDEIAEDPILAKTKLIAEPWDAGGLYQLGEFAKQNPRCSEWNDKYRDSVRKFIKGDRGEKRAFVIGMCGSDMTFSRERSPLNSVNFITSHDGFTLRDLVSYNSKNNTANAENDHDGNPNNMSWNCGTEGETDSSEVLALREKQMRNFHLAQMISQGIPMLNMGDEYGHTRYGNNNTWCHDDELNWFLWNKISENKDYYRFYKEVIHFRKRHRVFKLGRFLKDQDVHWHGVIPNEPDWEGRSQVLAFVLVDPAKKYLIYCAFNMHYQDIEFTLPPAMENSKWRIVINTSNPSPNDFIYEGEAPFFENEKITLPPHTSVLLKSVM